MRTSNGTGPAMRLGWLMARLCPAAPAAFSQSEDIMKPLIAAALVAGCLVSSTPTFAGDGEAGVFDKWLDQGSPECVPVSAIKSVSTVTDLTPEQFQFVRALYVALPPVSRTLPPGPRGHGEFGQLRDARACRRRPSLRTVSGPRFRPGDAGSGRPGNDHRAGHASMIAFRNSATRARVSTRAARVHG